MERKEVLVDTSSIVFGFMNKGNVFQALREELPGYTQVISRGVLRELKRLAESRKKERASAAAALAYISGAQVEVDGSTAYVDSWIARRAEVGGGTVCTNDIKLKRGLRARGTATLSMTKGGIVR